MVVFTDQIFINSLTKHSTGSLFYNSGPCLKIKSKVDPRVFSTRNLGRVFVLQYDPCCVSISHNIHRYTWRCSVQSCVFVQCLPRIFLMQCRGNLSNAGAAFAATGYHQKINQFKIKIAKKACYSDCTMLCGVSLATLRRSIKITLYIIFSWAMLPEASWTTLNKVFTCVILSQEY